MNDAPVILVVDDEEQIRRITTRILTAAGYATRSAENAAAARLALSAEPITLILTDLNMPGSSGIDLARHVASDYPDTATVMISGSSEESAADTALEYGAYAYMTKPVRRVDLLIAVKNALRRRDLELEQRAERVSLEQAVAERTVALERSREETIARLARAFACRDRDSAAHVERMSSVCALLAGRAGLDADMLRTASRLHDIGKIGVDDSILRKPGPLEPWERCAMQEHAKVGYEILAGSDSQVLEMAATIALTHHERWDGGGYPRGLAGTDIPLIGRITAIADVFDALTSDRVYRAAFSSEVALAMMVAERGRHFDPDLFDDFMEAIGGRAALATA